MANRLINIDELTIDLVDQINPFQRAYDILSKTVSADVLKSIHGAVALTKIAMTEISERALQTRLRAYQNNPALVAVLRGLDRHSLLCSERPDPKSLDDILDAADGLLDDAVSIAARESGGSQT